jgi:GR25 family glycosyltransferase involved in LPS biosynthesis
MTKKTTPKIINKYKGEKHKINKFFNKIFIINLEDKIDRWRKVSKKFIKRGIKFERFVAVDGRCNVKNKKEHLNKKKELEEEYGYKISKKINAPASSLVIGTLLILKQMVKKKWKRIAIFEDDIEFVRNFHQKFETAIKELKTLKEPDLFYLSCGSECGVHGLSDNKTSKNKYISAWNIANENMTHYTFHKNDLRLMCEDCQEITKNITQVYHPGGTWSYCYTLKGAKKMIKYIGKTIKNHIDQIAIKACEEEKLTAYAIDPPITVHEHGAVRPDTDIPW